MSLLLKKDYGAITVGEICDAANVGRSTFYLHYSGKDDLMRAGLDHLRTALVERQREALGSAGTSAERRFGFSLILFEHARHQASFHPTLSGGGALAVAAVREIIADLVRGELAATGGKDTANEIPRELVVQFLVGAYMAVLSWWLDKRTKLTAEEVDAMFRRLATGGIAPFLAA